MNLISGIEEQWGGSPTLIFYDLGITVGYAVLRTRQGKYIY